MTIDKIDIYNIHNQIKEVMPIYSDAVEKLPAYEQELSTKKLDLKVLKSNLHNQIMEKYRQDKASDSKTTKPTVGDIDSVIITNNEVVSIERRIIELEFSIDKLKANKDRALFFKSLADILARLHASSYYSADGASLDTDNRVT